MKGSIPSGKHLQAFVIHGKEIVRALLSSPSSWLPPGSRTQSHCARAFPLQALAKILIFWGCREWYCLLAFCPPAQGFPLASSLQAGVGAEVSHMLGMRGEALLEAASCSDLDMVVVAAPRARGRWRLCKSGCINAAFPFLPMTIISLEMRRTIAWHQNKVSPEGAFHPGKLASCHNILPLSLCWSRGLCPSA